MTTSPEAPLRSASETSTAAATIDPMTPVQLAMTESSPSTRPISSPHHYDSTSSATMSPLGRPRSRKRSVAKKRSLSKARKRSGRKTRAPSGDRASATSLGILQGPTKGVDVGTSISPKSQQAFHQSSSSTASVRPLELPLPFDVFWMAFCTLLAFFYAVAALHPDLIVNMFPYATLITAVLPAGASWQIFARCSAMFTFGSIPLRRWATNHLNETNISSDQIVFWVFGIIKLALIQMFMFKSNETIYQAAMLHASLGYAVQELIVNICSSSYTSSLQRMMEILGNSIILFVAEDDLSVKAMAYTLTTLTLAKVLRALILIASSRESYRAFRKAVTIGHTILLSFGIPFIGNFLMRSAKEMNADDNDPTYAHILGPFICAGVLMSSMILSHIDYFFS